MRRSRSRSKGRRGLLTGKKRPDGHGSTIPVAITPGRGVLDITVVGVSGAPKFMQIDRWTRAMPQYHLGHVERVAAIKRRLEGIAGLAIAGAAYEGVGIPQTIASGQAAAAKLTG